MGTNAFRLAEQQEPSRLQSVVENGKNLLLQQRSKIDEEVPATDKVQLGKRGILDKVLLCKDAHFTNPLAHLIAVVRVLHKKALQPIYRDMLTDVFGIDPGPGLINCQVTDISAENLNVEIAPGLCQGLEEAHSYRVSLLA